MRSTIDEYAQAQVRGSVRKKNKIFSFLLIIGNVR